MTSGQRIPIEGNPLQADQAAARRAAIVEQDSMKIAHYEEFQPPTTTEIRIAVSETSRAEGDYIVIPSLRHNPSLAYAETLAACT